MHLFNIDFFFFSCTSDWDLRPWIHSSIAAFLTVSLFCGLCFLAGSTYSVLSTMPSDSESSSSLSSVGMFWMKMLVEIALCQSGQTPNTRRAEVKSTAAFWDKEVKKSTRFFLNPLSVTLQCAPPHSLPRFAMFAFPYFWQRARWLSCVT